jgi:hypothetical protein
MTVYCVVRSDVFHGRKVCRCVIKYTFIDAMLLIKWCFVTNPEIKSQMYRWPVPLEDVLDAAAKYSVPLILSYD